ncbi:MAG: P-II family nitrogen regulator [Synergistaceae bacterium]|jgi:nitrogen regulatory protein PII|nr:P-II family nitrogen regulator [Synergistaceae bacterium]
MRHEIDSLPAGALLIVICDRKDSPKVTGVLKGRDTSFNLLTFGKGTANSKILNYLGLGQTEKTLLFSAMSAGEAGGILSRLDETLDLKRPGHGIAFTLPLAGAEEYDDNHNDNHNHNDNGGNDVTHPYEHVLILAVANRGYSQEVMDAARSVGATGGTIVHARGTAPAGTEKFFGVTIQPEKEIIMILASSEKKQDIMRTIVEKNGVGTPASAVTFAMPVCGVEGLLSLLPQAGA